MSPPDFPPEPLEIGPVAPAEEGQRLDAWLAHRHPDLSRARWQELIKAGHVRLDGLPRKPNQSVKAGQLVIAQIPPPAAAQPEPEAMALDILYEDADVVAVNKPPRLVVHPAPGHRAGTLVNALLHHCGDLGGIGGEMRPGIVHRLDQDTSGVLVVAKNEKAMQSLSAQFKDRTTRKEYLAMVWGAPHPPRGTIRAAIGRDPVHRKKMSVRSTRGRDAVTHYRLLKSLGPVSLLGVTIETGRTHQIRVHLAHLGHPVVGDNLYGKKRPPDLPTPVERQMLHAWKLSLRHPGRGTDLTLEAPVPEDMQAIISRISGAPFTPNFKNDS